MQRHSFKVRLALAVVTALGLAGPTLAAELVPFKGSFEGVVTHTPDPPPYDLVDIDAAGNASHLGGFMLAIPHIVDTSTRTAIGSYEFTAANGDTLTADFTGRAMPTATPGVIYIVETATITGGTGRFAGATGSFVIERLFDRIADTTIGSFKGSISSPGASKR
jgi:hypothetical protein